MYCNIVELPEWTPLPPLRFSRAVVFVIEIGFEEKCLDSEVEDMAVTAKAVSGSIPWYLKLFFERSAKDIVRGVVITDEITNFRGNPKIFEDWEYPRCLLFSTVGKDWQET